MKLDKHSEEGLSQTRPSYGAIFIKTAKDDVRSAEFFPAEDGTLRTATHLPTEDLHEWIDKQRRESQSQYHLAKKRYYNIKEGEKSYNVRPKAEEATNNPAMIRLIKGGTFFGNIIEYNWKGSFLVVEVGDDELKRRRTIAWNNVESVFESEPDNEASE